MIEVRQTGNGEPLCFAVTIRKGGNATHHEVTIGQADFAPFADAATTPARCIEAAFRFLLDREPKETILKRFDFAVIARYFPEFPREFPAYLKSR